MFVLATAGVDSSGSLVYVGAGKGANTGAWEYTAVAVIAAGCPRYS